MRGLLPGLNVVFIFSIPGSCFLDYYRKRDNGKDRVGTKGQLQKVRDSRMDRMSMLLISTERVANWRGREGSLNTYNCGISYRGRR